MLKFRFRARALELGMLLGPAIEESMGYWLSECTLERAIPKELPTPGLMGVLFDLLPSSVYRKVDEHRRAQQDSWSTVLLEAFEMYAASIPAPKLQPPRPDTHEVDRGWSESDSGIKLASGQ
jgi:hypothetical protein